jgi:hypothetical protein
MEMEIKQVRRVSRRRSRRSDYELGLGSSRIQEEFEFVDRDNDRLKTRFDDDNSKKEDRQLWPSGCTGNWRLTWLEWKARTNFRQQSSATSNAA